MIKIIVALLSVPFVVVGFVVGFAFSCFIGGFIAAAQFIRWAVD